MSIPSWLLDLVKPFLANAFAEGNAALAAAKPVIIADVEGLVSKNAPAVAAKIVAFIPGSGILGSISKQIIAEYVQAELASLITKVQANDSTWFDDLLAKVKSVEANISAAV